MMGYNVETSYLEVGYIECTPIRIPITTIGEGSPCFAILCGVHGDETASIVIARRLVQELIARDSLHGSVSIITSANPLAGLTRTRMTYLESLDLNRVAPGRPDGYLTERIAYKLCECLSQCSFFVDIHEFRMNTPTLALYLPSIQGEVDERILQGIVAFNPPLVWVRDSNAPVEAGFSNSILAELIKRGVPGFAIETTRLARLSSEIIHFVAKSLTRVIDLMNATEGLQNISTSPKAFTRKTIHSDHTGFWTPDLRFWTPDAKVKLLAEIEKGDVIGSVSLMDLINDIPVYAPIKGILMQLRGTRLVETGTPLFSIGVKDQSVTAKLQDVASALSSRYVDLGD